MEYVDLAEKLLKKTQFPAEVFLSSQVKENVSAMNNLLYKSERIERVGAGIRIIKDGLLGFSYTTKMTSDGFDELLRGALLNAQARKLKVKLKEFPNPTNTRPVKSFEPGLRKKQVSDFVDAFYDSIGSLKDEKYVNSVGGEVSFGTEETTLMNTSGISYHKETAFLSVGYDLSLKDKSACDASETQTFTQLNKIDFNPVTENAYKKGLQTLNPEKPETGQYDLLIEPYAFSKLARKVWIEPLDVSRVKAGKSYLHGLEGKQVFSNKLTLNDDPLTPFKVKSCAFDDEGVPTAKKSLYNKGVFESPLSDTVSAADYGLPSTGSGFRNFSTEPTPQVTNFEVPAGNTSLEELSSGSKCVLVFSLLGLHAFNTASGDLSVTLSKGCLLSKSERVSGAKGLALAINVKDLFREGAVEFSKERADYNEFVLPWVKISNVKLA